MLMSGVLSIQHVPMILVFLEKTVNKYYDFIRDMPKQVIVKKFDQYSHEITDD